METYKARMERYIAEYSARVWPGHAVPDPNVVYGDGPEHPDFGYDVLEVQADGYANAHVEGEHEAWGTCPYASAEECGERHAAEAFVETH